MFDKFSLRSNFDDNSSTYLFKDCKFINQPINTLSIVSPENTGSINLTNTLTETKFYIDTKLKVFGESFNSAPIIERYVGSYKFNGNYNLNSIPTTASYIIGDIVNNTNPTPGGYVGWICTVSGTPGTWKGFGLIAN